MIHHDRNNARLHVWLFKFQRRHFTPINSIFIDKNRREMLVSTFVEGRYLDKIKSRYNCVILHAHRSK